MKRAQVTSGSELQAVAEAVNRRHDPRTAVNEYGIEFLRVTARERTRLRHFLWKHMTRATLRGGPPLFGLVDQLSPRGPNLKSLP